MQFFDGFLSFLFPDRVFVSTISRTRPGDAFFSLLVSSSVFMALLVYIIKQKMPNMFFAPNMVFLSMIFAYCSLIVFIAAVSFLTDWIYVTFLSTGHLKIKNNFLDNFLCRTFTMPFWVFIFCLHVIFYARIAAGPWLFFMSVVVLRLLDIEARLIRRVYDVKLILGYTLVFVSSAFFCLGILLAAKIGFPLHAH